MVEYSQSLDRVFHSLADGTRRDILRRLTRSEQTISELAAPYSMSLAAIAKHVSVLEGAGLVAKRASGKERVVRLVPDTLRRAERHLSEYERRWAERYDALEALLATDSAAGSAAAAATDSNSDSTSRRAGRARARGSTRSKK